MPQANTGSEHRGIFMENGSGGFVSDLTFEGGKVCFVAGNQQYTARNLKFDRCEVAIEMLWDWGFTWKNIHVQFSKVAINATGKGKDKDSHIDQFQSTGSLTILDSNFKYCDVMLEVAKFKDYTPSVVLDNIDLERVSMAVIEDGGKALLRGNQKIVSWAIGRRHYENRPQGAIVVGNMKPPRKDPSLLDKNGKFFEREKPQYDLPKPLLLNILDWPGVRNDGFYPNNNTASINDALLRSGRGYGNVLVFPAGIYKIDREISVPVGARLVGALWPQLMAVGKKFEDPSNPQVFIKVGQPGDVGEVEISDLIFTQSGPTAGAIFMEWNIHEREQGSAAMWGTVTRVRGADGSGMRINNCHQYGKQPMQKCMASTVMLHVTKLASLYMEDVWLWVADHDIDSAQQSRINVYGARGALIESGGQFTKAKNIYLGHIQSETPYFQAGQTVSLEPYPPEEMFPGDPEFPDCGKAQGFDTCCEAWALRIIESHNVFFQNYQDECAQYGKACQDKLVDTNYSESVWLYNIFTVGANESLSPQGFSPVLRSTESNGFATATSAYLLLADNSANIGGTRKGSIQDEIDANEGGDLFCDYNNSFDSLEDLEKAMSNIPNFCAYVYAIPIYIKMMQRALDKFKGVNQGYDDVFDWYKKSAKVMVQQSVESLMEINNGGGRKYFMCRLDGGPAARCDDRAVRPQVYDHQRLEYELTDEDGFYKELQDTTGLGRDNIYFWTGNEPVDSILVHKNSTLPVKGWFYQKNYPKLKEDFEVVNPKDIVKDALSNIDTLSDEYDNTYTEMVMGVWNGPTEGPFQVLSVPAFMMIQAVDSMEKAKEIGTKAKDEHTKEMILTVLNVAFMLIPFLGEVGVGLTGVSLIAKTAGLIGTLGGTALGIYDAVEHPEMAPLAILGTIMGAAGLRGGRAEAPAEGLSEKDMQDLLKLRKELSPSLVKSMGSSFERNENTLQKIGSTCYRRK